jgi:hypothetical protein
MKERLKNNRKNGNGLHTTTGRSGEPADVATVRISALLPSLIVRTGADMSRCRGVVCKPVDSCENLNVRHDFEYIFFIINNLEVAPDTNQGF